MSNKSKQIIFSGPMIRAYYNRCKTMTRRVVKPLKGGSILGLGGPALAMEGVDGYTDDGEECRFVSTVPCPYGAPGDSVWVRETWQHSSYPHGPYQESCSVFYRADYLDDRFGPDGERSGGQVCRKWVSPLMMPRTASRLALMLTAVTVQRLLDISEEDAIDEGAIALANGYWTMNPYEKGFEAETARDAFLMFWDYLHEKRGLLDDANPFVWVLQFPRYMS